MLTPRGPVAGSFQHRLLPRSVSVSEAAAKIISLRFFFKPQYFDPDSRLARTRVAIPIHSVQNADCRQQNGYEMQIRYKMQTENLYCFFVWYVIICHLSTYRASRNRFSALIFHDYLHYCGIFLARFLITIVLNIISNLRIVISLCARVGWWDVCAEFTNLKVDVDINEMPLSNLTRAVFEKQSTALHELQTFHLFNRYVFILLTKMRTETKTVPSTWYVFNVQRCTHTDFHIGLHEEPANFCREQRSITLVIGHLFTFLVVLSLIDLVTKQLLMCENQIIWWREFSFVIA